MLLCIWYAGSAMWIYPRFLAYLNEPPGVLKYYGRESADVNDCEPTAGVWAVSATYLQNLYLDNRHCHDWLKSLRPKKVIGYSIFIYDVSEEDAQRWRETE